MLKRLFQKAWSAIVTTAKFMGKCMKAVADAAGISGLPLHAIRGDASLAHAVKHVTPMMVSKTTLTKVGAGAQCIAAKGVTISSKCGLTKVAGVLAKVVAASSLSVGTVVVGVGLTILFVGAVWILKRAVKKAEKFIDTLSSVEDTAVTIGDFANAY